MTDENTNTTPPAGTPPAADETNGKGKGKRGKKSAQPRAERNRVKRDFILQVQHEIKIGDDTVAAWVDIPDTKVKDTSEGLRVMAKCPANNKYRVIYVGAERTVVEETKKVIRLA